MTRNRVLGWLLATGLAAPGAGAGAGTAAAIRGIPGVAAARARIRLRDIPSRPPTPQVPREAPEPRRRPSLPVPADLRADPAGRLATAIRAPGAGMQSPPLASSFLALEDNGMLVPPDTHGAVGPDHLMVTVNTEVRILDRAGNPLVTVTLPDFWASFAVPFPFDPRVVYDPFGGRFLTVATSGADTDTASLLVGVSATSDPTGTWLLYRIDADPADRAWADFPTLGFNRNWVVVQANMFGGGNGAAVFALDRADLYAGGSGRFTRWSRDDIGQTLQPAVTLDANLDVLYLLNDWNGDAAGLGVVRLFEIRGPVGAETFTPGPFIAVDDPWASAGGAGFSPQLGSNRNISGGDSRMGSLVVRNGSLWAAQTVFLPAARPARAAAQWWELAPDGAVRQRGRVDDPSGGFFYAFPTLSVNRQNDALVGFSTFAASQHASAGYAFRAVTDPPGTMRDPAPLKAGEAIYVRGGDNRWGDYSHTVVDPQNDLDLWTIQEYAALPRDGKDRWSTWWGRIAPEPCPPPSLSGPEALDVCAGASARSAVAASGTGSLTYQWRKDGVPLVDGGRIAGATGPVLTVGAVIEADAGSYDVVVADACAGVSSSLPVALGVDLALPVPPGNVLFALRAGAGASLVWAASAGATFYEVDRCAADVRPCLPAPHGRSAEPSFADGDVPGDAFWYRIGAGNACGTAR